MAGSSKQQAAEQVRIDYRKQLFKAGEGLALQLPIVEDSIPGDPDGLMPVTKIDAPLKIGIPLWPDRPQPGNHFTNKLYIDWKPAYSDEFLQFHYEEVPGVDTLPDDQFPLERVIPLEIFENYEGTFLLRYRLKHWNTGDETPSAEQPITIDRTGPIRPGIPDPIIVLEPLITTAILNRDGGVKCVIPDFVEDKKDFVTVAVAWMDIPPTAEMDPADLAYLGRLPDTREILVPERIVTPLGSNYHYVVYFLFDKAGNRSDMPFPVQVPVALGNLPSGLGRPRVPLASDSLIDRIDAAFPTTVEIDQYTNWTAYDHIDVKWGTTKTGPALVGSHLPFPLKITVPWSHIAAEYDFDGDHEQEVEVDYEVLRGPHPTASPGKIDVTVDLSIPGPENPGTGPDNPDLELIRFKSFSNSATELTEADIGKPAHGYIELYDDPEVGDTLTLYWNGVAVSSPPYVVDGTEADNEEIELEIPWVDIEKTPAMSQLPMYYTLTHVDFTNWQKSDPTRVDVNVEVIDLEEPTFPDQEENYPLNCNALIVKAGVWGIRVHIPASNYLKEGVQVAADWQTYDSDKVTVLPDTHFPEVLTVSEEEEQDGIDWFIPYIEYLKPTYDTGNQYGWGKVKYTININGSDVSCDLVEVMIAVFENGGHCVIPRP